ncbi:unnamed protein product [Ixodes pacificus]
MFPTSLPRPSSCRLWELLYQCTQPECQRKLYALVDNSPLSPQVTCHWHTLREHSYLDTSAPLGQTHRRYLGRVHFLQSLKGPLERKNKFFYTVKLGHACRKINFTRKK